MRRFILLFIFIGCYSSIHAQYTEVINSRRPGFSDSPFSVGTDVLQFEGGIFYESQKNAIDNVSSLGTDVMLRYSKFLDKLEVNLYLTFQNDKITYLNPLTPDLKGTGFRQLTLGAKYLVYMPNYKDRSKEIRSWKKKMAFDWKRLIPAVAVYAGANIPITENYIGGNFTQYVEDSFSPRIAIYTQHDFTERFIFLTNLVMDKLGTDQKENSYILTGTYSLNAKWSIFAEHQGIFKADKIPNDFQFGGGLAYLFSKNMQLDASVRRISDRDGSTTLFGAGFAWRLDKHEDKFNLIDSDGNVTKTKGEGGFFKRLFGGKKDDKQRKVKKIKAKKRKVKENKPSKKDKKLEKDRKKKAKEEKKKLKKQEKDNKKNYVPPKKDDSDSDNN